MKSSTILACAAVAGAMLLVLVSRFQGAHSEVQASGSMASAPLGAMRPEQYSLMAADTLAPKGSPSNAVRMSVIGQRQTEVPCMSFESPAGAEHRGAVAVAISEHTKMDFPVQFIAVDIDSGDPIAGATCLLVQASGIGNDTKPRMLKFDSGSNGQAEVSGVTRGKWTLEVQVAGYEDASVELDLPGAWSGVLESTGAVDLREVRLIPSIEVTFQLEGAAFWGGPELFSIETLEDSEEVSFDSDGKVTLSFGAIPDPVLIRVNYPDGTEGWDRFRTDGAQSTDPLIIRVSNEKTLEVTIQFSPEAAEAAGDTETYVRTINVGEHCPSRFAAKKIDGSGVYVFQGIEAEHVNVGVVASGEGQQVEWAVEEISMNPRGTTAVDVFVDAPPIGLQFQDLQGAAAEGVIWRLRPAVEHTGWLAGGVATAAGTALVPRCRHWSKMNLYAEWEAKHVFLLDQAIDLSMPGEEILITLGPTTTTQVRVLDTTGVAPTGEVAFYSKLSRQWAVSSLIGDDGWTEPFDLVEPSKGSFEVFCDGYWSAETTFDLKPGRQTVTVYQLGDLVAGDRAVLGAIESVEFGLPLSTWIESGRVAVVDLDGMVRARVPIGNYRRQSGGGEWVTFEVAAP